MPYDRDFRDRVLEALAPIGDVQGRALFGGFGLFEGGAIFGLIDGRTLYFKVDDASKPRYLAAGSQPFNPYGEAEGRLFYYSVPGAVLGDPTALEVWWREAVAVGHATRRSRRRRPRGARS